jgi:hypothetical protein
MHVVVHRMTTQARSANVSLINVLPSTSVDTLEMIRGWQLNLHGVPPVIQQELDGTMNLHDVDIWMWLQKATPKKSSSVFRKSLWMLFQQSGRWYELASNQRVPSPIGDTFHTSITRCMTGVIVTPGTTPKKSWPNGLGQHGGIDISRAALLELFAECLASDIVCNHPATLGKCKWETLRASMATQGAAKCSLVEHIQCQQLDSDLDKDTATTVTLSSTIVVDDPTFPDKVVESHPLPTPYDQDDHMDTDSLEQLHEELYGNPS